MAAYELPMFPLEEPVLPGTLVPLRIFEPRYRVLAHHLRSLAAPDAAVRAHRLRQLIDERREILESLPRHGG